MSLFVFSFLDLNSREQETLQPVHVINVDIQDNHEEATLGAFLICELCQCVSEEWDSQVVVVFFYKSYILGTYLRISTLSFTSSGSQVGVCVLLGVLEGIPVLLEFLKSKNSICA